jgi:hypothetical protein
MRHFTRVVFGINAFYQMVMGILCLVAPALAIGIFGGTPTDESSALLWVAFRLVGVNLIPIGIVCAIISFNPETSPVLRQLMGLVSVLTMVCWGISIGSHDLSLGQLSIAALDGIIQLGVVIAVVGYYPMAKTGQFIVRRRAA